ncbi:MAG: hypothetical protein IJ242_05090 [Clostridia bacterium]|nr:hypothetical protein [Clostridia bacterium]
MQRIRTSDLTVMAFTLVFGLLVKRIVSPMTNVFTDFFRIPGGSAAVGFSLAFLIIGKQCVSVPFAGTLMGFVQSLLAIGLGFSGYQGPLAVITYTLPGLMIDLTGMVIQEKGIVFCVVSCVLSCITSALFSNILVFHLAGLPLMLWLLLAALSGILGGVCASLLAEKLSVPLGKVMRS